MGDYLGFLARTATLAVAVLLVVAGVVRIVARSSRRARHRPRLEVTDLGRRYDEARHAMQRGLLPGRAARHELRADRRRRKEADRARGAAPEAGGRRPRVFVLDFAGDVR